jgi:hypothetical protein
MQTYRLKGASGKVANQTFGLGAKTIIGGSANSDLIIDTDQPDLQYAEISLEQGGGLHLKQLDQSQDILVNGKPVQQASLASGDEIRIGSYRWVLQAPGLRPEKVLTVDATKKKRSFLPWLLIAAVVASAVLAWQRGWLPV